MSTYSILDNNTFIIPSGSQDTKPIFINDFGTITSPPKLEFAIALPYDYTSFNITATITINDGTTKTYPCIIPIKTDSITRVNVSMYNNTYVYFKDITAIYCVNWSNITLNVQTKLSIIFDNGQTFSTQFIYTDSDDNIIKPKFSANLGKLVSKPILKFDPIYESLDEIDVTTVKDGCIIKTDIWSNILSEGYVMPYEFDTNSINARYIIYLKFLNNKKQIVTTEYTVSEKAEANFTADLGKILTSPILSMTFLKFKNTSVNYTVTIKDTSGTVIFTDTIINATSYSYLIPYDEFAKLSYDTYNISIDYTLSTINDTFNTQFTKIKYNYNVITNDNFVSQNGNAAPTFKDNQTIANTSVPPSLEFGIAVPNNFTDFSVHASINFKSDLAPSRIYRTELKLSGSTATTNGKNMNLTTYSTDKKWVKWNLKDLIDWATFISLGCNGLIIIFDNGSIFNMDLTINSSNLANFITSVAYPYDGLTFTFKTYKINLKESYYGYTDLFEINNYLSVTMNYDWIHSTIYTNPLILNMKYSILDENNNIIHIESEIQKITDAIQNCNGVVSTHYIPTDIFNKLQSGQYIYLVEYTINNLYFGMTYCKFQI